MDRRRGPAGLDRVFLVAPSSTDARLRSTTAASRGFVYAASTMGVTGARATVSDAAADAGGPHPRGAPDIAVCVGSGVSNGAQAAEIAAFADGVIVGSAYVREMLDGRGADGVRALAEDLAPESAARGCRHDRPRVHPQPLAGRVGPGPLPAARLRPVHHRRHRRRRLADRQALDRPRRGARRRAGHRHRGRCRSASSAAGSTTSSPARSPTSARAATRCAPSRSGRAASASGAPSPSAASAPGSPAGAGASRCRPSPTRSPPGCCVAQAIGRLGNWFNQELFGRPTDLPWGLEIYPCDRRPGASAVRRPAGRARHVPPDVPLRAALEPGAAAVVIWADRRFKLPTAGRSPSTSPSTAPAGCGSSCCGSTPPTTSSASGSTCSPRSSSACSPCLPRLAARPPARSPAPP